MLAKRFGLKPLVIAGTLATSLQYPLLAEVQGVVAALFVLCAFSSVGDTVYWTSYHAYFASLGDAEHRGHQVGAREAVAAVVGIVGPLVTGWALTTYGPRVAFDATAVVLVLSALPIYWTPHVAVLPTWRGAFAPSFPACSCSRRTAGSRPALLRVADCALPVARRKLLRLRRRDGDGRLGRRR